MADETIYRCINDACRRPTPRPVNFCPWCGTAQARAGAAMTPQAARDPVAAATAAAAGASAAAAVSGWSDAPPDLAPAAPPAPAAPATARSGATVPPAQAQAKPAAAPNANAFGRSGKTAASPPPPRQEVPRPPLAAHPPARNPIRLRWWLLALALLWAVWFVARPSPKKIERRIDAAIALARECKAGDAQAELIALRKSRATPAQLQRLQQALNDEAAQCTKRRQRRIDHARAWNEASAAVESALAASGWDKARVRLQAFTKRWGEDEDTRALKERIEAARRAGTHPLAVPRDAVGSSGRGATGSGGGKNQ